MGCFFLTHSPLLQMFVYFDAFNVFFEEALAPLFGYFAQTNLTPDLYLIGWLVIAKLLLTQQLRYNKFFPFQGVHVVQ